jgi:predicted phosphodiesterase
LPFCPLALYPLLLLLLLWIPFLNADIAFYSDTQGHDDIHAQVVEAILKHDPTLVFHAGDLTSKGTQEQYDKFLAIARPLTATRPFWPVRGNHDRDLDTFLANFPRLGDSSYYTVTQDSLFFIVLDSNLDLLPGSEQYIWLENQLTGDTGLPRIVILHHTVFSSGYHGGSKDLDLWLPLLFARHRVAAVVCGHDHDYERLAYEGVSYLVIGGSGGRLRDPDKASPHSLVFHNQHHYLIARRLPGKVEFTAYGLDGSVLDTFSLPLTP